MQIQPHTHVNDSDVILQLDMLFMGDIPDIRTIINQRLLSFQISEKRRNRILLSCTEILTNLIRHPENKATYICISLKNTDNFIVMEIADNSTSFADFIAKREKSRRRMNHKHMDSGGRGLALIARQHPVHSYIPAEQSPDSYNHFVLIDAP